MLITILIRILTQQLPQHELDGPFAHRSTNVVLDKLTAGNIVIQNNDITSTTGTRIVIADLSSIPKQTYS